MIVYGSITRLVSIVFRKDSNDITLRPNQATTYTASRDIQAPSGDADHVLVSRTSTDTLTNKTLTAPTVNNGSLNSIDTFSLDDTNSAFDLTIQSTSTLTAGRTLTVNVNDAARTIDLSGNLTLAANFITAGANSLTLTTTGATNVTLPTTGTLATLAGTETLSNKTLASPDVTTQIRLLNQGQLQLREATGGGTDQINIQAPAALAASYTLTLPVDDGTSGQFLQTDGSGVLSWQTASAPSFLADWVTGDGTSKTVTHNLGSLNIAVTLYDKTNGETIKVDTEIRTNSNTLDLTSSEAPGAAGWKVVIDKVA